MENYYSILECDPEASYEEIKQAYRRLALQCHPDKTACVQSCLDNPPGGVNPGAVFAKIDKAWKVLRDPELKKEYDARWQQRAVAQEWPVQDEVDIEDLDENEDGSLSWDCRCGGHYLVTVLDVCFRMDYVACDQCSLCIKLVYSDSFTEGHKLAQFDTRSTGSDSDNTS